MSRKTRKKALTFRFSDDIVLLLDQQENKTEYIENAVRFYEQYKDFLKQGVSSRAMYDLQLENARLKTMLQIQERQEDRKPIEETDTRKPSGTMGYDAKFLDDMAAKEKAKNDAEIARALKAREERERATTR